MNRLLRFLIVVSAAALATLCLLSLILFVILRMDFGTIAQKMKADGIFYILPAIIFAEFGFLINDLLALFAKTPGAAARLGFSEVRFTYELDNNNTPISLKTKLRHLYPICIGFASLLFVLVLLIR
jgi:hypothetical protein